MSWRAEQAQQRRADRAAAAEQARLDAQAANERRIRAREADTARQARERADRAEQHRAARDHARAERARRLGANRAWLAAHRVDLLIYPLAVASAIMAIPAMATYGRSVYGTGTGVVLPVLSELGMWAFALAVQAARRHEPDRPVWALRTGVLAFAAVGFGLNLAHGLHRGIDAGVVMGVASIAGVAAHQLVAAGPRATRTERAAARRDRAEVRRQQHTARKTARVERAAVAQAVAELDTDGHAVLVHPPGRYVLARGTRGRLLSAAEHGRASTAGPARVEVSMPGLGVADEAAAWLAGQVPHPDPTGTDPHDVPGSGPVATVDPDDPTGTDLAPSGQTGESTQPGDRQESTPTGRESTPTGGGHVPGPRARSMQQLRVEFARALADESGSFDPCSAESIRRRLGCSAARARQLRNEHTGQNHSGNDHTGGAA